MKTFELSRRDRRLLSPVLGKFLCFGTVILGFLAAMLICLPVMGFASMIPQILNKPIADLLNGLNVHPWLVSIFSIILPNTLYFCLAMAGFVFGVNMVFGYLEEIGFLARAAYQFDNLLSGLGLQGKAICPILMGFGCTIGGTCGTRVMDNWGQRMLTMAVVWAVPCASIWTIIPVISSMFFTPLQTILVILGVLNAVFVGEGTVLDATFRSAFNVATDNAVLGQAMTSIVSKAEALAFMCACTFNIPCVMALSTTYRESHSLKWTARIAAFYVCGALVLACIVYHISALFL